MERMAIEYLVNAFWQLPVLAFGAWLLLRMCRPGPAAQHRVWLVVLAVGLLLPLRGVVPAKTANGVAALPMAAAASRGETVVSYRAAQSGAPSSAVAASTPDTEHEADQAAG